MPALRSALALCVLAGVAVAQPAPKASVRTACAADVRKFCAAEMLQGRSVVTRCMRAHARDLSPECRSAAMAHRSEMKANETEAAGAATPQSAPPS